MNDQTSGNLVIDIFSKWELACEWKFGFAFICVWDEARGVLLRGIEAPCIFHAKLKVHFSPRNKRILATTGSPLLVYPLYTSLCTGELNAIRKQNAFSAVLSTEGRVVELCWAELKPKGPKGSLVGHRQRRENQYRVTSPIRKRPTF